MRSILSVIIVFVCAPSASHLLMCVIRPPTTHTCARMDRCTVSRSPTVSRAVDVSPFGCPSWRNFPMKVILSGTSLERVHLQSVSGSAPPSRSTIQIPCNKQTCLDRKYKRQTKIGQTCDRTGQHFLSKLYDLLAKAIVLRSVVFQGTTAQTRFNQMHSNPHSQNFPPSKKETSEGKRRR